MYLYPIVIDMPLRQQIMASGVVVLAPLCEGIGCLRRRKGEDGEHRQAHDGYEGEEGKGAHAYVLAAGVIRADVSHHFTPCS